MLAWCRALKTLSVEDSDVADKGGEWLHALAMNNTGVLEVLNFAVLGLDSVDAADLTLLVEKCKNLYSLKVGETELVDMVAALTKAGSSLKELGAGSCFNLGDDEGGSEVPVSLPSGLTGLSGLWALGDPGLAMVLPVAPNLKKLDLKFTLLSTKAYCQVFSLCHSLEELQVPRSKLLLSHEYECHCCQIRPCTHGDIPKKWDFQGGQNVVTREADIT